MSGSIWNNPLMWSNNKKLNPFGGKNDDNEEYGFDFEKEKAEAEKMFSDFEKKKNAFQQESGMVDAASKAAEYKEVTPQMGGNAPNPADQLNNVKKPEGNSDATSARSIADDSLDRLLGNTPKGNIPSLASLLESLGLPPSDFYTNIDYSMLSDDDEETDIAIAEKLGITTDDIFQKGTASGLSPLQIVDNINSIRSSMALDTLTAGKLDSQDLTNMYFASLNNDTDTINTILQAKGISLEGDFTASDIMELSQSANDRIFKSVYLN